MIQTLLTTIFLCATVGYAAWRIRQAFLHADDPCTGCQGCELKHLAKKSGRKPCENQ